MNDKKILVVDDDPDVRQGMQIRFKANHYETWFANDGVSSIVEARKHNPDVIILDLGLPAGDGFVVLERLKNIPELAGIPVIVVSARDVILAVSASSRPGRMHICRSRSIMPNSFR